MTEHEERLQAAAIAGMAVFQKLAQLSVDTDEPVHMIAGAMKLECEHILALWNSDDEASKDRVAMSSLNATVMLNNFIGALTKNTECGLGVIARREGDPSDAN